LTLLASVYLRLVLLRTSKLAVSFTSRLKSLLLKSNRLTMKLLVLLKKYMASGVNLLLSLVANLNPRLQLQFLLPSLKDQTMLRLTKLKSKLTLLKTSLNSLSSKSSWKPTFEKKNKSQKQSTTPIKTTWRPHSKE